MTFETRHQRVYRAFETRQQRVYRGPFISEDRNFDLSTALFHVTMYRQFARKVGTSANSALIRYYLPRLKLSSSTLTLARERTPSNINMFCQALSWTLQYHRLSHNKHVLSSVVRDCTITSTVTCFVKPCRPSSNIDCHIIYTVVPALGDPRREQPPALYGHIINAPTDTFQR